MRAAIRASGAVANAAQKASPMVLNTTPSWAAMALMHQEIMTCQGIAHRFGMLLPKFGAAFDIRKEKCDRPGRQAHRNSLLPACSVAEAEIPARHADPRFKTGIGLISVIGGYFLLPELIDRYPYSEIYFRCTVVLSPNNRGMGIDRI